MANALAQAPLPSAEISADPQLASARPPEGLAVAIVGAGLDYRDTTVSACMARDGEGVPISWDLVDQNETPFSENVAATDLARNLCATGKVALVVARFGGEQPLGLPDALSFVFQTPARLVVIANRPLTMRQLQWLRLAGDRAPDRLILVSADQFPVAPPSPPPRQAPRPVSETVLVTGTDPAKLERARALGFSTLAVKLETAATGTGLAEAIARVVTTWHPEPDFTAMDIIAAIRIAQGAGSPPNDLVLKSQTDVSAAAQRVKQQKKSQQGGANKP